MYLPGQIIWDLDKKVPVCIGDNVWDIKAYPKRNACFIAAWPEMTSKKDDSGLFLKYVRILIPKSVVEAEELLSKNIIVPSPCDTSTHCWKCGNWNDNCKSFGRCSESRKHK